MNQTLSVTTVGRYCYSEKIYFNCTSSSNRLKMNQLTILTKNSAFVSQHSDYSILFTSLISNVQVYFKICSFFSNSSAKNKKTLFTKQYIYILRKTFNNVCIIRYMFRDTLVTLK